MMKRYEIQILLRAGHSQAEVARLSGACERTVRTVAREAEVRSIDDGLERCRRAIGRPSKAEPFGELVTQLLTDELEVLSLEVLRRARLAGYTGGKTVLYDLVAAVRPAHASRQCRTVPSEPAVAYGPDLGPPHGAALSPRPLPMGAKVRARRARGHLHRVPARRGTGPGGRGAVG